MKDHDVIREELERLKKGGVIRPVDVVQAAEEEDSPLHELFTWDDGEAAHQYRLMEARNLLRVYVITEESDSKPVRAFVSLTTDRTQKDGGYRTIADVMSDEALYDQMLRDAFVHLRNVQQKYKALKELSSVWSAVDEAEQKADVPAVRKEAQSTHAVAVSG